MTKIFELFKNFGKVFLYTFLSYLLLALIAYIVLMIYNLDVYRAGVLYFCDTQNIQSIVGRVLMFFMGFLGFVVLTGMVVLLAVPTFWIHALRYFINPIEFNIWMVKNFTDVNDAGLPSFLLAIQFYGVDNGIGYTLEILTGFSILLIISFICILIYFLFFNYKSNRN
tara:strand:+ start:14 stop:517 length:504 start_codon:yes stop_codon:yes gene_type:complete